MSHHFDYPTDETLDISDAYCFAGPGDLHGPRTVFGMDTSPYGAPTWNAEGPGSALRLAGAAAQGRCGLAGAFAKEYAQGVGIFVANFP
jgi:hypothetical protein